MNKNNSIILDDPMFDPKAYNLSKKEKNICEIARELGQFDLLQHTLTCYNPNEEGQSCGKCPSCAERIANFAKVGVPDPIPYSIDIDWDKLIDV